MYFVLGSCKQDIHVHIFWEMIQFLGKSSYKQKKSTGEHTHTHTRRRITMRSRFIA